MPPYHILEFFPDVLIRGGSNYTLNLSFVVMEYLKLVSGQKNSYATSEAAKVGWVAKFLLCFCLKFDYNFTFTESWKFPIGEGGSGNFEKFSLFFFLNPSLRVLDLV